MLGTRSNHRPWRTRFSTANLIRISTMLPSKSGAPINGGSELWFAAENVELVLQLYSGVEIRPEVNLPAGAAFPSADRDEARSRLLRGQMEALGPVTAEELGQAACLDEHDTDF